MNHQGQFPVVTASFNLAPGVSLGRRGGRGEQGQRRISTCRPACRGKFQGTAAAFQASLTNEPILILAALVTVYIVLGVLYESYIHPITILSTLPSAGVGALLALMSAHTDFSIIALIGIILLIGIVEKNAIMMIDFALDAQRKEGKPPQEAIYQACLLRFRPIMMTTMAALLRRRAAGARNGRWVGVAPAAGHLDHRRLDFQPVADACTRRPVIYLWFDRLARRVSRRRVPAEWTEWWKRRHEEIASGADALVRGRRPRRPSRADEQAGPGVRRGPGRPPHS